MFHIFFVFSYFMFLFIQFFQFAKVFIHLFIYSSLLTPSAYSYTTFQANNTNNPTTKIPTLLCGFPGCSGLW